MGWARLRRESRSGLIRLTAGVAAVGLLSAAIYSVTTIATGRAADVIALDRAQFIAEGAPAREVVLPHTWARDGLGNAGRALYRIEFQLAREPGQPWGLQAPRLSSRHLVRLNGQWLHGGLLESAEQQRGVPVPTWIDIAPDLLRAGTNLLEVEVAHDYRAGLSVLRLGPETTLWRLHVRDDVLQLTLPRSLNLFGIGLALFIFLIWWRRRSESALGLFAALLALLSVRNVAYSSTGTVVHTSTTDVLFYLANLVGAMLLGRFAMAWAGRDWPWFRRAMDVGGAVLIAAAIVAVQFDAVQQMRVVTYPVIMLSLLPSLALMGLGIRREPGATRVALAASVTMLCLAPIHDYAYIRGFTSVDDFYWMPFVAPIALVVFAWAQLDRFVGALAAVEDQAAQLELKVAERTRELELANSAKTRFLAAASHDLRQPVASIGLLADLLRDQPLPPATHRVLGRLGDSVQALNGLLKGLLDLSRFDAGAVQARIGRVALLPILELVVGDQREAARRKGIELRLRATSLAVECDALLLEQVVRNLVGNAVRYTERGGVLVAARRRGQRVLLQVWDTGIGIAEESQALVFEEFVQLDNPARGRSHGIGLGLSLVRRAAAVMGAPLGLRSRAGRGSCFWIDLPVAASGSSVPAIEPVPQAHDLAGLKLWVVEDDPDVLEALRLRLCGWGAQVRAFVGAAAAADAIDEGSAAPDVLVTDQRLPDGSGLAVARRLRARFGLVPVLVVTGDTSPADVSQLRASGLTVMHKPFASDELLAALRALAPTRALRA
ncbi:MAG TPA: hybrid sensor histidine kinase/response regulator [Caldimonas sp.]|nr:hybrid sensor histidine kinase/response regulator [Caldimonas sp.]